MKGSINLKWSAEIFIDIKNIVDRSDRAKLNEYSWSVRPGKGGYYNYSYYWDADTQQMLLLDRR